MACSSIGLDSSITRNDVGFFFLEFFVEFSMDVSCSRLFMSYVVGSFQSLGVWQQLSRLSLLSCFLSLGVSTSGSLSSPVLVKLYFPCLFMLILYGLQIIPISLVLCIPLSSVDGSFPWCSEFVSVLLFYQGLQKLFDGICSCWSCSWEISTGILLSIYIVFWCCFQYYIILLSGSLVVVHHSLNYPYHKGCCWHSQLW